MKWAQVGVSCACLQEITRVHGIEGLVGVKFRGSSSLLCSTAYERKEKY